MPAPVRVHSVAHSATWNVSSHSACKVCGMSWCAQASLAKSLLQEQVEVCTALGMCSVYAVARAHPRRQLLCVATLMHEFTSACLAWAHPLGERRARKRLCGSG